MTQELPKDPSFRYPLDRLIPFDLEEAKKPGALVSTADGRPVEIRVLTSSVPQPVVGIFSGSDGNVHQWGVDGRRYHTPQWNAPSSFDLRLVRRTKTLYAVQYVAHFPSGLQHLSAVGVKDRADAETTAANYKASIKGKPNCMWYSDVEIITREVPV